MVEGVPALTVELLLAMTRILPEEHYAKSSRRGSHATHHQQRRLLIRPIWQRGNGTCGGCKKNSYGLVRMADRRREPTSRPLRGGGFRGSSVYVPWRY